VSAPQKWVNTQGGKKRPVIGCFDKRHLSGTIPPQSDG
jgi:hypothetical protein